MGFETGVVERGYEPVASAFYATIADGGTAGAAVCVLMNGRLVVSLAAGTADPVTGAPFTTGTLVPVASVTKGLASVVIARLVESGRLPSYDTKIEDVWPEFAAHGKGKITMGDLLAHRAGVSAPREALSKDVYLDSLATADVLAAQEPLWAPGTGHQYHAFTHGALTSKLAQMATGRTLGALFAEEVTGPLAVDAWIGLPSERDERVAALIRDPDSGTEGQPSQPPEFGSPGFWVDRAMDLGAGLDLVSLLSSEGGRRAELPGVNGIASAAALATIWSSVVVPTRGIRLLSDEAVCDLRRPRSAGPSVFAGPPPYQSWGAGVMVPSHWQWYLSETSLGHDGAGGQVAFADPYTGIGFAYVTNQLGDWDRGKAVVAALSRAVL
ncbi:serine hydrolase domain-containing protein [Rathayibacter sp. KR2-224]|uniref:serine hydrolase domain-containing protein n=1 Tax=Rathayibacter sp. KR2-224 TaxID=3400913 RepID=UPI003C0204D5